MITISRDNCSSKVTISKWCLKLFYSSIGLLSSFNMIPSTFYDAWKKFRKNHLIPVNFLILKIMLISSKHILIIMYVSSKFAVTNVVIYFKIFVLLNAR